MSGPFLQLEKGERGLRVHMQASKVITEIWPKDTTKSQLEKIAQNTWAFQEFSESAYVCVREKWYERIESHITLSSNHDERIQTG